MAAQTEGQVAMWTFPGCTLETFVTRRSHWVIDIVRSGLLRFTPRFSTYPLAAWKDPTVGADRA